MPMNKLPRAALKAKDTGHTHGHWGELLSATNLGSSAFHLNDTRKIVRDILRHKFYACTLSATIIRSSAV
jgi:hypothetical protein